MDLVEVYATVSDARGEPVLGLNEQDFDVTEDGLPQVVATFAAGEFPLSAAVGLDHSFSMSRERLASAVVALRGFLAALRPSDSIMVLAIGSQVEIIAPLSTNHAASAAALDSVEPWGTTSLYDAILEALEAIQTASGRRALILLSDGMDRYSRAREGDVINAARRRDVLIYPIALGKTRPPIFAELASISGARSFQASEGNALQKALSTIAAELRFQYLIGYTPARPKAEQPGWHSIRVTVNRPGLAVRARDGYFSR